MKRSYLLFIAVLLCGSAFAQSGSRVIAYAGFRSDTTSTPVDTASYQYPNNHGGKMLFSIAWSCYSCEYPFITLLPEVDNQTGHRGDIKFDTAWRSFLGETMRTIQTIDGDNIISFLRQTFDSGLWNDYTNSSLTYDINNNLLQETNQVYTGAIWGNTTQSLYSYDAANNLLSATQQQWDTSHWTNTTKTLYNYNVDGAMIAEESKSWDMTTAQWKNVAKRYYYYSGSGLDSFVNFEPIAPDTTYLKYDVGYYSFSPTGDSMSVKYTLGTDTFFEAINKYDIYGNKTARIEYNLDPLTEVITTNKWEFTYNLFNQLTIERSYNMDSSGNWVFAGMNKFYYELYTPASTVQISPANNTIAVYPSPTKNLITIKLEWNESKPFSIGIYDMNGRMVKQWTENAANSFAKTLPIPGLAAGNYIIKATNGAEEQTGRFVVGN